MDLKNDTFLSPMKIEYDNIDVIDLGGVLKDFSGKIINLIKDYNIFYMNEIYSSNHLECLVIRKVWFMV
jgi:hypothetical protein